MAKVQPKNKAELLGLIEISINNYGSNCDLNFIDTSLITDMSDLFCGLDFNGDISRWMDKKPEWYSDDESALLELLMNR